ncbi:MAG: LptA/OstA family protein [Bdellovibrionota bacterium]
MRLTHILLLFMATFSTFDVSANIPEREKPLFEADFENAPTYIKAEQMTLSTSRRVVEYRKNVELIHEDMTLTCDRLEATYSPENVIQKITARDNVFIIRDEGTQARSELAIYDKATDTITLTINPEIQENGSIVNADTIRIFLKEDRSEAEGEVRVKLVQKSTPTSTKPTPTKDTQSLPVNDEPPSQTGETSSQELP